MSEDEDDDTGRDDSVIIAFREQRIDRCIDLHIREPTVLIDELYRLISCPKRRIQRAFALSYAVAQLTERGFEANARMLLHSESDPSIHAHGFAILATQTRKPSDLLRARMRLRDAVLAAEEDVSLYLYAAMGYLRLYSGFDHTEDCESALEILNTVQGRSAADGHRKIIRELPAELRDVFLDFVVSQQAAGQA